MKSHNIASAGLRNIGLKCFAPFNREGSKRILIHSHLSWPNLCHTCCDLGFCIWRTAQFNGLLQKVMSTENLIFTVIPYLYTIYIQWALRTSSSHNKVKWYRTYTLSLDYSGYLKVVLLFDWFQGQQMEPITEDLSLHKQNMLFIEMVSENCLSTELDWKCHSDWFADNNKHTSWQSSSPTFR